MNIKYISDPHRGLSSLFVAAQECPLQADVQKASRGPAERGLFEKSQGGEVRNLRWGRV